MTHSANSDPPALGAGTRRDAERVKMTCLAWIEDSGASVQGIARTIDLTPKGVGMVLSAPLPVGVRVAIELLLPGTLRLRAQGAVVHVTPLPGSQFRVGVKLDAAPVLVDRSSDKGDE